MYAVQPRETTSVNCVTNARGRGRNGGVGGIEKKKGRNVSGCKIRDWSVRSK